MPIQKTTRVTAKKQASALSKEEWMPKKRGVRPVQNLRGFKDHLPSEQKFWQEVFSLAQTLAHQYGYKRIDTPILEPVQLFKRSLGDFTDIVSKEMFTFKDGGGENVVLRPEATASIVRAYIQHGMFTEPQPIRLWYWGPMFRYERPQAGRTRQFYHLGFESIGDNHPIIDAQHILICFNFFQNFGITPLIQINSIGDKEDRKEYAKRLTQYYKKSQKIICADCKKRLTKNPLRLLDCKQAQCQPVKAEAPQIIDHLGEEAHEHFTKVLEYLDEMEVPYQLNPYLVRGLDYYNRTVYEIFPSQESAEEKAQSALGGGGRYDTLIENLGGRETPAVGFSLGVERVLLAMRDAGYTPQDAYAPDVYIAQLGEQARREALKLIEDLRIRGFKVAETLSKDGLKPQLEHAAKLKARFTLIIGQKEVLDNTIIIRDMESSIQEIYDRKKTAVELAKKFKELDEIQDVAENKDEEKDEEKDERDDKQADGEEKES